MRPPADALRPRACNVSARLLCPSARMTPRVPLFLPSVQVTHTQSPPHPRTTNMSDEILPGDIVSVSVPAYGRREGLVVGAHYDTLGRHIVEIQFDPGDHYHAWYPTVTRIRKTTYLLPPVRRTATVERRILW